VLGTLKCASQIISWLLSSVEWQLATIMTKMEGSTCSVQIMSRHLVQPESGSSLDMVPSEPEIVHLTLWDLALFTVGHIEKGILLPKARTGGAQLVDDLASSFASAGPFLSTGWLSHCLKDHKWCSKSKPCHHSMLQRRMHRIHSLYVVIAMNSCLILILLLSFMSIL
jgi:hypothetical protein